MSINKRRELRASNDSSEEARTMTQPTYAVICGLLLGACSGTTTGDGGNALSEESATANGQSPSATSSSTDESPAANTSSESEDSPNSASSMQSGSDGEPGDPNPDVRTDEDASSRDDSLGESDPLSGDDEASEMTMPTAPAMDSGPMSN